MPSAERLLGVVKKYQDWEWVWRPLGDALNDFLECGYDTGC
jgi:hypothetical protein